MIKRERVQHVFRERQIMSANDMVKHLRNDTKRTNLTNALSLIRERGFEAEVRQIESGSIVALSRSGKKMFYSSNTGSIGGHGYDGKNGIDDFIECLENE